jgi:periplasmic divalent cation tolerance protein
MPFTLIYTTHKNQEEAERITLPLLENSLIACVNYFPITSQYKWKGEIEKSEEVVAILKTRKENWDKVREYIEKNHSYETPCIIKLADVEANTSYTEWIHDETK